MSDQHVLPIRTYLITFVALLLLLGAAVAAAYMPLGQFHLAVTLSIAAIKAMVIMVVFMHLKDSSRLTWVFAGGSFVWLGIMLTITMADYLSREWLVMPGK
ncbi:cytochrome C oxidase subunit IV family protein [Isosphaeraceae bacterium EP7]